MSPPPAPRKSATIAWLLWLFAGWLGAHRIYLGRWVSGLVYLASFGLFGVGLLIDLFFLPVMVRDANAAAAPVIVIGSQPMPLPLSTPLPAAPSSGIVTALPPTIAPSAPPPRRCDYCGTMATVVARRCGECGAALRS